MKHLCCSETRSLPGGRGCPRSAGWWPCSFSPPARAGTQHSGVPRSQGQGQGEHRLRVDCRVWEGSAGRCAPPPTPTRTSSPSMGVGAAEGRPPGPPAPQEAHVCLPRALLPDTRHGLSSPHGCTPCPCPPHTCWRMGPGRQGDAPWPGPLGSSGGQCSRAYRRAHARPRAQKGTII